MKLLIKKSISVAVLGGLSLSIVAFSPLATAQETQSFAKAKVTYQCEQTKRHVKVTYKFKDNQPVEAIVHFGRHLHLPYDAAKTQAPNATFSNGVYTWTVPQFNAGSYNQTEGGTLMKRDKVLAKACVIPNFE